MQLPHPLTYKKMQSFTTITADIWSVYDQMCKYLDIINSGSNQERFATDE